MRDEHDAYADVRTYDPSWDVWIADASPAEKEAFAVMLRDTFGYRCWKIGVSSEKVIGPIRDRTLRSWGVFPPEDQEGA